MNRVEINPEYVYITIPAEYVCVYHRILAMMADYGEELLKDCKATCTSRNSNIIECFNMFNSAVAARKLGKAKLAETLIKYIKAKINQIYKGKDNSTSFVFPVDENGDIKAFVSCGERPSFWIDERDMNLYEHKINNGFDEHFKLGIEDDYELPEKTDNLNLKITMQPRYERRGDRTVPCLDYRVYLYDYDLDKVIKELNPNELTVYYYFDDSPVKEFSEVETVNAGFHKFTIVAKAKDYIGIEIKFLEYENN